MMTLEQAKSLTSRDEIHHDTIGQDKGRACYRARLTSSAKTWKREPNRVEVRFVHGLRDFGYITQEHLSYWHLASECTRETSR